MKSLTKLALAAVILCSAFAAQADWVSGYTRNNGTVVQPYYRTPANGTPYDNLSYRGYPSQQPGYVSPRSYSPTPLPCYGNSSVATMPYTISGTSTSFGNTTYHNYQNSFGGSLSGTTTSYGNTAYTTLSGW
jgi:hypothetical protein